MEPYDDDRSTSRAATPVEDQLTLQHEQRILSVGIAPANRAAVSELGIDHPQRGAIRLGHTAPNHTCCPAGAEVRVRRGCFVERQDGQLGHAYSSDLRLSRNGWDDP